MTAFICRACGTRYADSGDRPPAACAVCEDERQFVPPQGQGWTTLDAMRRCHRNAFERYEPGLYGIDTVPAFGIGQRALLVRTPAGNVLWDCIALIDDATVDLIQGLGGLAAIAISHPHYYTTMAEWSRAFGGVPVHVHAADRDWIMEPDPALRPWEGARLEILPGLTMIHCGGHFDGSAVLHWAAGADGAGILLTGDTIAVAADARWCAFARSFPNRVPLPAAAVRAIVAAVEPFAFERLYGGFRGWDIAADARAALRRSADRYLAAVG